MNRKVMTLIILLVAGALSTLLFTVKHQMQDMEDEITALNRSIAADEQAIHVLKAEWSHLNDPQRLRSLASRYLGLSPLKPEQLGSVADLSVQVSEGEGEEEQVNDFFHYISSALSDEEAKR